MDEIIEALEKRQKWLHESMPDEKILFAIDIEYNYIISVLKNRNMSSISNDDSIDIKDLRPVPCIRRFF